MTLNESANNSDSLMLPKFIKIRTDSSVLMKSNKQS